MCETAAAAAIVIWTMATAVSSSGHTQSSSLCNHACVSWPRYNVAGFVTAAGKVLSAGELLTALEGAPLDTIYLDASGQEKGVCGAQAQCSSTVTHVHFGCFMQHCCQTSLNDKLRKPQVHFKQTLTLHNLVAAAVLCDVCSVAELLRVKGVPNILYWSADPSGLVAAHFSSILFSMLALEGHVTLLEAYALTLFATQVRWGRRRQASSVTQLWPVLNSSGCHRGVGILMRLMHCSVY